MMLVQRGGVILFFYPVLFSMKYSFVWSGRHNTLNYLHYVIDHHFLTLIDYTKMVDGLFDGSSLLSFTFSNESGLLDVLIESSSVRFC